MKKMYVISTAGT